MSFSAHWTVTARPWSPNQPDRKLSSAICRTVEFIERNYAKPITLANLAQLAGLSLHRFVTVFRCQVGVPPHQYLCRCRVDRARALLRQGLPPAAVAVDTGLCDQSHLSRHFKRHCGMTPGSYFSIVSASQTCAA